MNRKSLLVPGCLLLSIAGCTVGLSLIDEPYWVLPMILIHCIIYAVWEQIGHRPDCFGHFNIDKTHCRDCYSCPVLPDCDDLSRGE